MSYQKHTKILRYAPLAPAFFFNLVVSNIFSTAARIKPTSRRLAVITAYSGHLERERQVNAAAQKRKREDEARRDEPVRTGREVIGLLGLYLSFYAFVILVGLRLDRI